jgi:hypothetical protein
LRQNLGLACLIWACIMGQSYSARPDDITSSPCARSASGTVSGAQIRIIGEVHKGAAAIFTKLADGLAQDTSCPMLGSPPNGVPFIQVLLDSQGGDVMEALDIGREVRRRFGFTTVVPNAGCSSACVFVLVAGVERMVLGKIGLHRPAFDPAFFSGLSPTDAREKYNFLLEKLRHYFVDEMGGSPEAFRLMMATESGSIRYLSTNEISDWGIAGDDPAFAEYSDAQMIQRYGRERWAVIVACTGAGRQMSSCEEEAYRRYPER